MFQNTLDFFFLKKERHFFLSPNLSRKVNPNYLKIRTIQSFKLIYVYCFKVRFITISLRFEIFIVGVCKGVMWVWNSSNMVGVHRSMTWGENVGWLWQTSLSQSSHPLHLPPTATKQTSMYINSQNSCFFYFIFWENTTYTHLNFKKKKYKVMCLITSLWRLDPKNILSFSNYMSKTNDVCNSRYIIKFLVYVLSCF